MAQTAQTARRLAPRKKTRSGVLLGEIGAMFFFFNRSRAQPLFPTSTWDIAPTWGEVPCSSRKKVSPMLKLRRSYEDIYIYIFIGAGNLVGCGLRSCEILPMSSTRR